MRPEQRVAASTLRRYTFSLRPEGERERKRFRRRERDEERQKRKERDARKRGREERKIERGYQSYLRK